MRYFPVSILYAALNSAADSVPREWLQDIAAAIRRNCVIGAVTHTEIALVIECVYQRAIAKRKTYKRDCPDCHGCGGVLSDVCHCGDLVDTHGMGSGHSPVEMEERCEMCRGTGTVEIVWRDDDEGSTTEESTKTAGGDQPA